MQHAQSDIFQHYEECLKLFTENKINTGNVWNLRLIDDMKFVVEAAEDAFKIGASCLEIATKIYCTKVDDAHNVALRLAGELSSSGKNARNVEENEESVASNKRENRRKRNERRKLSGGNKTTIVKDYSVLTAPIAKLSSNYFHSHKKSELNTLQNFCTSRIPMDHSGCKFMLLSRRRFWARQKKRDYALENKTTFKFQLPRINDEALCLPLRSFEISEWDLEKEDDDRSSDNSGTNSGEKEVSMDDLPVFHERVFQEKTILDVNLDHSYGIGNVPVGNLSNENLQAVVINGRKRPAENVLTQTNVLAKKCNVCLEAGRKVKIRKGKKSNFLQKEPPRNVSLDHSYCRAADDLDIENDVNDNQILERMVGEQVAEVMVPETPQVVQVHEMPQIIETTNIMPTQTHEIEVNCPSFAKSEDFSVEEASGALIGKNLVPCPKTQVPASTLPFAKSAKTVDIKKLKTAIKSSFRKLDNLSVGQPLRFSTVFRDVKSSFDEKERSELSPHLAIFALLHVASEENLRLDSQSDLRDVCIYRS